MMQTGGGGGGGGGVRSGYISYGLKGGVIVFVPGYDKRYPMVNVNDTSTKHYHLRAFSAIFKIDEYMEV